MIVSMMEVLYVDLDDLVVVEIGDEQCCEVVYCVDYVFFVVGDGWCGQR